jgi:predicted ATPase/DNA-binding CsgD family transcriptional regulator
MMAHLRLPLVFENCLLLSDEAGNQLPPILVGSDAWYTWLAEEQLRSFSFRNSIGTFTVRRERQRHGWYWYVYCKREGKLRKAYLGKMEEITLERLNAIATSLAGRYSIDNRLEADSYEHEGSASTRPLQQIERSDRFLWASTLTSVHASTSVQPIKQNLPLQLTTLIGREQEITTACALLRRPEVRLVTLSGAPGIGKTRLGLQVAGDLVNDFADGVCFIPLASIRDPNLVLSTIAQTLEINEAGDRSLLDHLQASLKNKHLLLLLDNFEQVTEAAPRLAELLMACPHLKIFVTSRAVLHIRGEHEFSVPPLTLPDLAHLPEGEALTQYTAIHLFLQRAQTVKPDFQMTSSNASAIARLCVHLDGLPLAIELAAARIKLLPPQALLARIDQRLAVLTNGPGDVPARQQTLRNTIAWSYQLLDAHEQRLFKRISVFAGGCTLQALEAINAALGDVEEAGSMLERVASLIDKSLLQQIEPEREELRFMMLETIREYGREVLISKGEMEATQRAYAAYYLALAEEAEPMLILAGQEHWLLRLEQEHENLRAALSWLLEQDEIELALRMCSALGPFWRVRDYLNEGWNFLERALSAKKEVATVVRAKALIGTGMITSLVGNFDQAETLGNEALRLFRELGDTLGLVAALCTLGQVALDRSDYVAACTLVEEALVLSREVNDLWAIASSLWLLSYAAFEQGDYVKARTLIEEALTLSREMNNTWAIASSLVRLAQIFFFQGDHVRAYSMAGESLALARKVGDKKWIAYALAILGYVAFVQGDQARSRSLLEESLTFHKEVRDLRGISIGLYSLGWLEFVQGNLVTARALFEESQVMLKKIHLQWHYALCLDGLAAVVSAQEHPEWAAQIWGATETLRETLGLSTPPLIRVLYESTITAARAYLGEKAFAGIWAEGRTMTPEQALAAKGSETISPQRSVVLPPLHTDAAAPFGLTRRELEVLHLVAQGLTDAQVAENLVISHRTVNTHLTSIYGKIGVSSRSAATRYVIEHHII